MIRALVMAVVGEGKVIVAVHYGILDLKIVELKNAGSKQIEKRARSVFSNKIM